MSRESRLSSITSGWSRPICGNHCNTRLCWVFCCSIASWCGSPKRGGRSRQPLGHLARRKPKPKGTRLPIVLQKTFPYNPGLEASYRAQECRMNPFSGRSKCAARAAVAVVAIATLSLAVGCGFGGGGNGGGGGGGNTGFSNAILNGQYVFSQKGLSITQDLTAVDFFSEGGVFTADGNGNLTNIIDEFTQSGQFFTTFGAPLTGTYHINNDGTGLLTFNFGG